MLRVEGGGLELAAILWATVGGLFLVLGADELAVGRGARVWLILGLVMVVPCAVAAGRSPVRALRSYRVEHGARIIRTAVVVVLMLLLAAVLAGWLYSHLEPHRFGECKQIALSIGNQPTVTECQAYGASDFLVPFVAIALALVVVGEGDLAIIIPWLGEIKRTKEGKEAVKSRSNPTDQRLLQEKGDTLVETIIK